MSFDFWKINFPPVERRLIFEIKLYLCRKKILNNMNKLEFSGNRVFIRSTIDKQLLNELQNYEHSIEYIHFFNYEPNVSDLKVLNEYFKINKKVVLRCVEKGYLEYLPDLENIEYLKFDSSQFDELKFLKKLNSLDFRRLYEKLDLTPILEYKDTLTGIAFEGDLVKNGENVISQLTNLKKVTFISSKFNSFEFLSNINLETFRYYGSRTTNYEHIKNIKSLKNFWLKTNTKWEDFDFLSELENLETIELHYVSSIKKFPNCSNLKKLKKVIAFDCNKLADIEELKKLNCYVHAYGKMIPNKFYTKDDENE